MIRNVTAFAIATRNERGQIISYKLDDVPGDLRAQIAATLTNAAPRKRGRPTGYRCSPETRAKMSASHQARFERKV